MKKDIEDFKDIQLLVDTFYSKVRKNPVIGGIFESSIEDWPTHLEILYSFWESLLFDKNTYTGNPLAVHMAMPLEEQHFEVWLGLWRETHEELFVGPRSQEAIQRAELIAQIFQRKIEQKGKFTFKPFS